MRSARIAPEKERLATVLVERVEERRGECEQLDVGVGERQGPQEHVEAGSLGSVVAIVSEVGLVHDLRELPEHGVGKLVAFEERLEAAVAVEGLNGFSANDWLAPTLTFVVLGVYGNLRIPSAASAVGKARAVATIVALVVNVVTI